MKDSKLVNEVLKSLRQFTIGNANFQKYKYIEGEVREYYPERVPLGGGYSLMALESAIGNIRNTRRLDMCMQSVTTMAMALMAYGCDILGGPMTGVFLGGLGLGKLLYNDASKSLMKGYENNVQLIKKDYKKKLEKGGDGDEDDGGEGWKRGTEYGFSQDL